MRLRNPTSNFAYTAYTLVEILVVLAVMAIVAGVVIPSVIDTGSSQAMSAAREIMADLEYAQSTAITTQMPVTVTFNLSGDSYTLSNASGTLIHPINKTGFVVNFKTLSGFGQTDLATANFGGNAKVTFDESGSPDYGGTLAVQAGPHVYQVTVAAATGKISVVSIGS